MSTVPSEAQRFDGTVSANVHTYPDYCRLVWAAGEIGTQLAIGIDFKAFHIAPNRHQLLVFGIADELRRQLSRTEEAQGPEGEITSSMVPANE